jgi:hypothetical protein
LFKAIPEILKPRQMSLVSRNSSNGRTIPLNCIKLGGHFCTFLFILTCEEKIPNGKTVEKIVGTAAHPSVNGVIEIVQRT